MFGLASGGASWLLCWGWGFGFGLGLGLGFGCGFVRVGAAAVGFVSGRAVGAERNAGTRVLLRGVRVFCLYLATNYSL